MAVRLGEVLFSVLGELQGEVVGQPSEAQQILSELQQHLLVLLQALPVDDDPLPGVLSLMIEIEHRRGAVP